MPSDPFGNAQLLQALMDADVSKLRQLHASGVSFNVSDSTYGTPLSMAISMLKPDLVEFLLDHDADPNFQPKGPGDTALVAAVLHKEVGMVKLLLARGANPNQKCNEGGTPLITAISVESLSLVQILLEAGADLLAKNTHGVNALKVVEIGTSKKIRAYILQQAKSQPHALAPDEAARVGQVEPLKKWLDRNPNSRRIIHLGVVAAAAGQNDVVKLLLAHGLDPNAQGKPDDKMKHWPNEHLILWAIHEGHAEVVQTLVDAGANVNLLGRENVTPLMVAVSNRKAPIVKILLAAGAEPMQQDKQGHSAMSLAKQGDLKQIGKMLEKAIAQKPVVTSSLLDAVRNGLIDQTKHYLSNGADIEALDGQGLTALQLAASLGNVELLRLLLEHGARVQPVNAKSTWEHALNYNTKPEIVQALLEGGLDVNQQQFTERVQFTPLQYAVIMVGKQIEAVLDLMLNAGADVQVTHTPKLSPELQKSFEALKEVGSPMARMFGGTKTLLELASTNRKASAYLKTRLGIAKDAYDLALEQAKQLAPALETEPMAALVQELANTLHARPQPWKKRKGVISFWVKLAKVFPEESNFAGEKLHELAGKVHDRGAHLIYARLPEGSESRTELLFFPTIDPSVVMAACGVNGANYGLATRDVVKWFAEVKTPFQVIGCSFDFVDVRFKTPIADPVDLLQKAVKFCPDMDEKEGMEDAAAELNRSGDCFFWWD